MSKSAGPFAAPLPFSPALERWFADAARRSDERAEAKLRWVRQLHELCGQLVAGEEVRRGNWSCVYLFWIMLHGLVTEFIEQGRPAYEMRKSRADEFRRALEERPSHRRASLQALLSLGDRIHETACAVRDELSFPELVLVDYLRQSHAHLTPNRFGLNLTKKLEVSDKREIGGRQVTVEEVDRLLAKERKRHRHEAAAAKALAIRLEPKVKAVREALEALSALDAPA